MERICPYCKVTHRIAKIGVANDFCCHACEVLFHLDEYKDKYKDQSNPFEYLKDEAIISSYLDQDSKLPNSIFHFYIEGLQCSSCVHLLEQLPQIYPNCNSAQLNFGQSKLTVELNKKEALSEVCQVIVSLGYQPIPLKSDAKSEDFVENEKKSDLKKLAIAGLCASQIMIFSFAIYFGADGYLRDLFRWGSLLLFLPILFYSALPFYKGAWAALKFGTNHIDLPIVIALWSTTAFSFWHFYKNDDSFYFDSTAGFLFLILFARYFVKRTQAKYLSPKTLQRHFASRVYSLSNGSFKVADQIVKEDVLQLSSGQPVPTDSILLSDGALFDTSMMNGESRPNYFSAGLPLLAGYKLISGDAKVKAVKPLQDSELTRLVYSSFQNVLRKNNFIAHSDHLAKKLITTVFAIGVIALFVLPTLVGAEEAVRRVLALFVVACPCALAFGSPLTLALAFSKAQKLGIAIRNPNIFEKLSRIKNVFLDKTGTLTEGQLKMDHTWPDTIDLTTKRIVIEMEKISLHPIAFAIRSAWENQLSRFQSGSKESGLIHFSRHVEKLGSGIKAELDNAIYEIKALPENGHENCIAVGLFKDREPVARLYFDDPIRNESKEVIQMLEKQNIHIRILSGDRRQRTLAVAEKCGIAQDHVFAELYPEDKEKILSQYQDTLMIGDGLNDSLALSRSDVGICMSNSHELTIHSSDVTFFGGGLKPLLELFRLQKTTLTTLNRNLMLALIYNGIAGSLALAGVINPLFAAVLMPASTGLVVMSSLWGFR